MNAASAAIMPGLDSSWGWGGGGESPPSSVVAAATSDHTPGRLKKEAGDRRLLKPKRTRCACQIQEAGGRRHRRKKPIDSETVMGQILPGLPQSTNSKPLFHHSLFFFPFGRQGTGLRPPLSSPERP